MSLSPEQLAMRRTGITATDIVVLSGESPYGRTKHDVWIDKMGLSEPFEPSESMTMGHMLEPVILQRVAIKRGLCIVTPCATLASKLVPWAMATIDGAILDGDTHGQGRLCFAGNEVCSDGSPIGLVEAKAVGFRMARHWFEDDVCVVPSYVQIQCQWGMFVRGYRKAVVGALIGTEVHVLDVAYDEELVASLVEIGDRFRVDHVLTGRPPEVDGSESSDRMLRARFPRNTGGTTIRATKAAENWAREYFAAKQQLDSAMKAVESCKQSLMSVIGENDGAEGDGWKATWINNASGGVDWKGVASELGATPQVIEKYTRPGPRVFRCVPKKGDQ